MPLPLFCPNPECPNHRSPPRRWYARYGSYHTLAHGEVQRFRCVACRRTCSEQTESLHYYAKRRVPFREVQLSLAGGSPMREIARRYRFTPAVIERAVIRLGRQSMAAHARMLTKLNPRTRVCADGLRSFVTSKDYPCDITTVVDPAGEVILSSVHSTFVRGGTMTASQQQRLSAKLAVWRPKPGTMSEDISLVFNEMWEYLRPEIPKPLRLDTDCNPLYVGALERDPVANHWKAGDLLEHHQTPSTDPRTNLNPLASVNYVDRLLRHRVREHFRRTFAFGRNASAQMHRFWIFAFDLNCRREWRVKVPELGVHAAKDAVAVEAIERVNSGFYVRRVRLNDVPVPETLRRAWMHEIPTPPHRWKKGQKEPTVRVPKFAIRDLAS